jgi:hypothetical protein|tara:strand:- start:3668 stop:3844 length:177 start_codon:yes stop_codon:yes gene_type:complete
MWELFLPFARSVALHLIDSPKIKLLVVELLEQLALRTDNKLDDLAVAQVRKALIEEEE